MEEAKLAHLFTISEAVINAVVEGFDKIGVSMSRETAKSYIVQAGVYLLEQEKINRK